LGVLEKSLIFDVDCNILIRIIFNVNIGALIQGKRWLQFHRKTTGRNHKFMGMNNRNYGQQQV
jgi:hypothetical protein